MVHAEVGRVRRGEEAAEGCGGEGGSQGRRGMETGALVAF